jgi:glycosyltransferase involved in cell wall biosynthesis
MSIPKVVCFCCTKGRFEILRKSISFFLAQDYENKELVIMNNHEVPLVLSEELQSENITVVNKGASTSIEHFVDMMNEVLQTLEGDFIAPAWDDDDVFLPWHISSLVKLFTPVTQAVRTTPNYHFYCKDGKPSINMLGCICEPTHLARMDFIKEHGIRGAESNIMHWHASWLYKLTEETIVRGDDTDTAYVLVWDRTCFDDYPHFHGQCVVNNEGWEAHIVANGKDTGEGKPLTSCDVKPLYQKIYDALHNMECPVEATGIIRVAIKLKQYL